MDDGWGSAAGVLHPLVMSRTDVHPNPAPHIVVWAGPLFGTIFPIVAYAVAWWLRSPTTYLFRFFAGTCAVINGAYIGVAAFTGDGDADIMLLCGSPQWLLVLFGVISTGIGLALWHNQSPHFGIGKNAKPVHPIAVGTVAALLCLLVTMELLFSNH